MEIPIHCNAGTKPEEGIRKVKLIGTDSGPRDSDPKRQYTAPHLRTVNLKTGPDGIGLNLDETV